jgi:hypothetical protein
MPKAKVIKDAIILGTARKAGDSVELTEHQAKAYVRRGLVEVKESKKDAAPEGAPIPPELAAPTVDELKAKLDALGVKYRANATKENLAAALAEKLAEADPTA